MQYISMIAALAATASAGVISRQDTATEATFAISNFTIQADSTKGSTIYNLQVANEATAQSTACTLTTFPKGDNEECYGAPPVAGFSDLGCNFAQYWSWSITPGQNSDVQPAQPGYQLQLNYTESDGTVLTGCYFVDQSDFQCVASSNTAMDSYSLGEVNIQATTRNQCIYG